MNQEPDSATPTKTALLSRIPAFPPIVLRVLDLLSSDDVEIRKLTQLILADAVFSAQVLRLANSPQFGHKAQIDSLQHALVTLGLRRVQALTMQVATGNYTKAALKFEELRHCWRHTLACAVLSEELARACGVPDDSAYSLGLLHDIGRLGLLVSDPAGYAALLRDSGGDALGLLDLEKARFGTDHCETGRLLAERWHLPQDFVLAAGRHHDPLSGGPPDQLAVVHLACRLADVLGFSVVTPLQPPTFEETLAQLPPAVQHRLVADPEVLRETVERRIQAHDSTDIQSPPAREADPDPEPSPATELAASEPAFAEPAAAEPAAAEPAFAEPAAATPRRSLVWDLAIVGMTGLIFTAVLFLAHYLWNG